MELKIAEYSSHSKYKYCFVKFNFSFMHNSHKMYFSLWLTAKRFESYSSRISHSPGWWLGQRRMFGDRHVKRKFQGNNINSMIKLYLGLYGNWRKGIYLSQPMKKQESLKRK